MNRSLQEAGFDELDRAILEELQVNGRISVADLARKIHLSQPAVHNRIRRLEREGIIREYVALVDREMVGFDLLCFVEISIQTHSNEQISAVEKAVYALPEVLECYRMMGQCDLLIKIAIRSRKELDRFIGERLTTLPGIERVQTNLVLNEVKTTTALPLK